MWHPSRFWTDTHLACLDEGLRHFPVPAAIAGGDQVRHATALKEGAKLGAGVEDLAQTTQDVHTPLKILCFYCHILIQCWQLKS